MMTSSNPPRSPKPKRGRPPTEKGQRGVRVTVTFHEDEYKAIKAMAKKPTTFIHDAAVAAATPCKASTGT